MMALAAALALQDAAAILERGKKSYEGTAYREALGHFEEALRLAPSLADARAWAGLASLRLDAVEQAQKFFEGADLTAFRLEEARAWASLRRWEEALRAAEAAAVDSASKELKGLVLVELGRAVEALPLLDDVLEKDAARAITARLIRARARTALKQFSTAREDLEWIATNHADTLWEREARRRLKQVEAAEQAARAEALRTRDPEAARDEQEYALRKAVDDLARKVNVLRRTLGPAAIAVDTALSAIGKETVEDVPAGMAVARALEKTPEEAATLRGSKEAREFVQGQIASWRRTESSADARGAAQARQVLRILNPLKDRLWPE